MAKHVKLVVLLMIVLLIYICLQIHLVGQFCLQDITSKPIKNLKCELSNEKLFHIFLDSQPRDLSELERRKIPNMFHLVFCSRNRNHLFTFNHYLTVLSIWRNFEPDGIEIHYKGEITQDKYNTWLDDLKLSIPSLLLKEMPDYWQNEEACGLSYGLAVLHDRGGVLVLKDIILTKHALRNMQEQFTILSDEEDNVHVIFSQINHKQLNDVKIMKQRVIRVDKSLNSNITETCDPDSKFNNIATKCCILKSHYLPKDLIHVVTQLDQYLQSLYRADYVNNIWKAAAICPTKNVIPNIVHYVWFHPVTLSMTMYLSLISTLYIVKPDRVFIHGDLHLDGYYWDKVKDDPRIVLVYRESPTRIFGHKIKYTTHGSDVVRADVLLKYGGIYIDWDVIWLKPVDKLLTSGYDVIVNYDHMVATKSFPAQLNLGVAMATPRSQFIQKWRDAFVNYKTDDFYYNALELPYKIYEQFPDLVRIEKKLQVMCFRLKCHPIFHKNHRDWTRHQSFDWRQVYSVHFTFPDPPEYKSEETLLNSTGLFSDIGKFVLSAKKHHV